MEEPLHKAMRETVKYWWLLVLTGAILIGLSIWILFTPAASYLSLSILFSIILTLSGLTEVAFAVNNRQSIDGWIWLFIGGVIDLAMGLYLLLNPDVTMSLLPILLGIVILLRGVFTVGSSFGLRSLGVSGWGWELLFGIALAVFAFLMISNPAFGMFNIVIWTSMAFLFAGIFRISLGLRFRRIKERLDHE